MPTMHYILCLPTDRKSAVCLLLTGSSIGNMYMLDLQVDTGLNDILIGEMYSCNFPCFWALDSNNFGDH